jgi:hypothetical protein
MIKASSSIVDILFLLLLVVLFVVFVVAAEFEFVVPLNSSCSKGSSAKLENVLLPYDRECPFFEE